MSIARILLAAVVSLLGLAGCTRTDLGKGRDASSGRSTPEASPPDAIRDDVIAWDATDLAAGGPDVLPGSDQAGETATADDGCLIAVRTDVCCPDPHVISRFEMDEDPCLQPYASPIALPECVVRRPANCATVDCAAVVPPSSVVGRGPGGNCQYLSECESPADCIWAIDARACCSCPRYFPRVTVERDSCLQDPSNRSSAACPDTVCRAVRCDMPVCPYPSVTCATTDVSHGLNVCLAGT